MSNVGPAVALFRRYLTLLEVAGYSRVEDLALCFGHFDNGVGIPDIARQMYQSLGEDACQFGDPFHASLPRSYYEWLCHSRIRSAPVHKIAAACPRADERRRS